MGAIAGAFPRATHLSNHGRSRPPSALACLRRVRYASEETTRTTIGTALFPESSLFLPSKDFTPGWMGAGADQPDRMQAT